MNIEEIMKKLNCTKEEAILLLEDDKKIDKGEKLFELNQEQKTVEKKMRSVGSKVSTVYTFKKRERKADNDKRYLINFLVWSLTEDVGYFGGNVYAKEIKIINEEREIEFFLNNRKFKLTLSAPRS